MDDSHAVAGAIPAVRTILAGLLPFKGLDTSLRSLLAEVRILSVALYGSCVTIWDDLGFQVRGAAFDSLVACDDDLIYL